MKEFSRIVSLPPLAFLTVHSAPSQPGLTQSPEERRVAEKLPSLKPPVEELGRAIDARDLPETLSALKRIDTGLKELRAEANSSLGNPPNKLSDISETRRKLLNTMEQAASTSAFARDQILGLTSKDAEEAGDYVKAKAYAREALAFVRNSRYRAQHTYYGNHVLGLVALHEGDIAGARAYLLASTDQAGWDHMTKYGPNLTLAKRLLEKGERDVVIDFLEASKRIWPEGRTKLVQWQAIIRAGALPEWDDAILFHRLFP